MNNDLIERNLAISYAASGSVKRIDGEDWIRVSEVKQSLNDVPAVIEDGFIAHDYIKEKMFFVKREGDNQSIPVIAIDDLVAFERSQGHWINSQVGQTCSRCKEIQFGYDSFRHFCPNCGAKMKGSAEE